MAQIPYATLRAGDYPVLAPFSRKDYDPADFRTRSVRMREDPNALTVIETSFGHIRVNLDHPVAEA